MSTELHRKLFLYQLTTAFGILFALAGFSYNVWRMEISEDNSSIRLACFEVLTELAALEQVIYAAHYDHDVGEGSPRKAWVKVGLIRDLSTLTAVSVEMEASRLHRIWSEHWDTIVANENSVAKVIAAIDSVRAEVKSVLKTLP